MIEVLFAWDSLESFDATFERSQGVKGGEQRLDCSRHRNSASIALTLGVLGIVGGLNPDPDAGIVFKQLA